METEYLLFFGTSEDGRGNPDYVGRTTDKKQAYKHFKLCENNPYSNNKVMILTDDEFTTASESMLSPETSAFKTFERDYGPITNIFSDEY